MTIQYADRVKETSTTVGTGAFLLNGPAGKFQSFVDGVGNGGECYYGAVSLSQNEWEVGLGTVTAGVPDTLTRVTILASSNNNLAVNFSVGEKEVFLTHPAARINPPATETHSGVVVKATTAEAQAGTADKYPDAAGVHAAFNQFGLGVSGFAPLITDLNSAMTTGFYRTQSNTLNRPSGMGFGTVLVKAWDVSSKNIVQEFTGTGNAIPRFFYRTFNVNSDTWGDWREILHTGSIQQTTGSSTELPMSQKAVTDALNTIASTSTTTIFTIKGELPDVASLPTEGNTVGDSWIVGLNLYVWTEDEQWIDVGEFKGPKGETTFSKDFLDHNSAGLEASSFLTVDNIGEFIPVGWGFSNTGPVVVSESGRGIFTKGKFAPRGRIFLVYVRAWGSPDEADLDVLAMGYDKQANEMVNAVPLGIIPSGKREGVFVFDAYSLDEPVWGLAVQTSPNKRFVVASLAIKPYEGVYKGEDIKITAQTFRDTAYQDVALFGLDQMFDIYRNQIDVSSDYIERTQEGIAHTLTARKAILKRGRSFQIIASSSTDTLGVLLHQTASGVPGRVQLYVNRAAATGVLPEHINLYIEGLVPQLPPMPYILGEKFSITINVDDEDNVELYYGTKLWGRGVATNGIADIPMALLGGGLTAKTDIRIYSVSCIDYEDRALHLNSAIPNPYLVSNGHFTENTGNYACVTSDGIIRSRLPRAALPPASLTKVLSALVILDRADLTDLVEVLAEDATTGSGNNLQTGDVISLEDLLYNMMLPSSNVAASVAARHVGGDVETFVTWLNEKAQSLGMVSSTFVNPHGLAASGQTTNAIDMLKLCKAASNYTKLQDIWSAPTKAITVAGTNPRTINVSSSVQMLGDDGVIGGKTGTLTGGTNNLMIYAKNPNGTPFWGVVLGASTSANRYAGMREALKAAWEAPHQDVRI